MNATRCIAVFVLLTAPLMARAAETPRAAEPGRAARVLGVRGTATLLDESTGTKRPVEKGMVLRERSTIETKADAAVQLRLGDGSVLGVGPSARMTVDAFEYEPQKKRKVSFKVGVGKVWARVTSWFGGGTNDFSISTNNAVAGVRGTELIVIADPNGQTTVLVVHGLVAMSDLAGGPAQMLVAMVAGVLAQGGTITVRPVTPAELEELDRETQVQGTLSPEDRENLRVLQVTVGNGSGGGGASGQGFQLNLLDSPPPGGLPLVPGVGRATVSGRVEVRP